MYHPRDWVKWDAVGQGGFYAVGYIPQWFYPSDAAQYGRYPTCMPTWEWSEANTTTVRLPPPRALACLLPFFTARIS